MPDHGTYQGRPRVRRTYEKFQIRWSDGGRWSGYTTAAEAQERVDFAASKSIRQGRVERHTFTVDIPADRVHMYRPGISDETIEVAS